MKPNRAQQVEGLVWIAIGVALCIGSIKMGLGALSKPRSGFLPFLTGGLLALLGLILTLYKTFEKPKEKGESIEFSIKKFGKNRFYSLIALFIYASLLEPLGFFVDSFLFLFFLFKILDPRKWFVPILISVVTVILSYFLFHVWLRINLPRGIFNIG